MDILLLEDNAAEVNLLRQELEAAFGGGLLVEVISTEAEFQRQAADVVARAPHAVVIDVMLPWEYPRDDVDLIRTSLDPGHFRAGIRCAGMLRARGYAGPLVFYTILEESRLAADVAALTGEVHVLTKSYSSTPLVECLREVLGRAPK